MLSFKHFDHEICLEEYVLADMKYYYLRSIAIFPLLRPVKQTPPLYRATTLSNVYYNNARLCVATLVEDFRGVTEA